MEPRSTNPFHGHLQRAPGLKLLSPAGVLLFAIITLCILPHKSPAAANHLITWGSTNHGIPNVPVGVSNIVQISAGAEHGLLLTSDGTIIPWGDNSSGQTNLPPNLPSTVVAISAGYYHSLALLADGSVAAWGDNTYGQCNVPPGLKALAVSGGGSFSAAITTNRTLAVWGFTNPFPPLPADFTNLVQIAAGDTRVVAKRSDGTIMSWETWIPPVPPEATNVTTVAAGSVHNMVLRSDGAVVCWGLNSHGQVTVPTNLPPVAAVWAGGYRSLALLQDGTIREWGDTSMFPVPPGLTNITMAAAGEVFTVVYGALLPWITTQPASQTVFSGNQAQFTVAATGTPPLLFQWQHNGLDIPDATNATYLIPAAHHEDAGDYRVQVRNDIGQTLSTNATLAVVDAPPTITVPSTELLTFRGGAFTIDLSVQGSLPMYYQWQKDGIEIPNATSTNLIVSPVPASAAGDYWVIITNAFGCQTSPPVTVRLLPFAWWGALPYTFRQLPVQLTNAVALSVRDWDIPTGLALLAGGTLTAWGNTSVTQIPSDLTNVVAISAGNAFCLALTSDARVRAWGRDTSHQTRPPTNATQVLAVAAGCQHSLALKADGTVVAWGSLPQASPPAGLTNVVAIAAGYNHSAALRRDGTVVAWGNNIVGQTNVTPNLANVVKIAAGNDHTLALTSDGRVYAWGYNARHQTEVPPGLTNVIAIAAGPSYSMALCSDGSLVLWGAPGPVTNLPPKLEGVQAIWAASESAYAFLGDSPLNQFATPIGTPSLRNGVFRVDISGLRGTVYRLEFIDALSQSTWTLSSPLSSDGSPATLADPTAVTQSRFYRIRQLR